MSSAARGAKTLNQPPDDDSVCTALKLAGAAVYEHDPTAGTMRWADPAAVLSVLGVSCLDDVATVERFHTRLNEDARRKRERLLDAGAAAQTAVRVEYPLIGEDGAPIWVEERATWLSPRRLVGLLRSIEGQRRRERALAASAREDDLTGLLARPGLREAMEQAIARAARRGDSMVYAVLSIDDLSALNARFGFDAADELIAAVGQRLSRAGRGFDVTGRIAGNKFGLLFSGCAAERAREAVRRVMREAGEGVVETALGPMEVSLSAGAVVFNPTDSDSRVVMAQAEVALDAAKAAGPGELRVASPTSAGEHRRARQAEMSSEILRALEEDRIAIAYQPIARLRDGAVLRYECLARLQGVSVDTSDFIQVAETTGLIRRVDMRVLEHAGAALTRCGALAVSVNVSGATVRHSDAAHAYLERLRALGVAERLTVELTETCVVEAHERVAAFADAVRATGARFSVDDFGAGYTSFRVLQAIEPDEVKIDGAFVRGVAHDARQFSFVDALVRLARSLSMDVIAEFVSEEADAAALARIGVDAVQGRLYGMPDLTPPTPTPPPTPPRPR